MVNEKEITVAEEIINKVAQSGLITIDLEEYYQPGERVLLDIKDRLFQGLLLREKDFREYIKNENWENFFAGLNSEALILI